MSSVTKAPCRGLSDLNSGGVSLKYGGFVMFGATPCFKGMLATSGVESFAERFIGSGGLGFGCIGNSCSVNVSCMSCLILVDGSFVD